MTPRDPQRSDGVIKEEIKSLEEINQRQEARVNNLEDKSQQDMSRYFLFQGVILASVMMETFDCRLWWVALAMTIVVGLLNLVNLGINTHKYLKCSDQLDRNRGDIAVKRKALRNPSQPLQPFEPDQWAKWRGIGFICFNLILCLVSGTFVCASCVLHRCHQDKAHSRSYQHCFCCLNTTAKLT